jgi:hypothetical protein
MFSFDSTASFFPELCTYHSAKVPTIMGWSLILVVRRACVWRCGTWLHSRFIMIRKVTEQSTWWRGYLDETHNWILHFESIMGGNTDCMNFQHKQTKLDTTTLSHHLIRVRDSLQSLSVFIKSSIPHLLRGRISVDVSYFIPLRVKVKDNISDGKRDLGSTTWFHLLS